MSGILLPMTNGFLFQKIINFRGGIANILATTANAAIADQHRVHSSDCV